MENIPMNQTNDIALWRELRRNDLKELQVESFYIFGDACDKSLLFDHCGNIYCTEPDSYTMCGGLEEFDGIKGKEILNIRVVLGEIYAVVQNETDCGTIQKNLYSAFLVEPFFQLRNRKIMSIAFSDLSVIVVTENREFYCYPNNVNIRISFPFSKIIDSACNNFVQILLTDHNDLLLRFPQQTIQNTMFQVAESESLLKKFQTPIKRIVSYGKKEILIVNQDGQVYDCCFKQSNDGWNCDVAQIATDGPISEVVGGPDGYVLVHQKDDFCWAWDQYQSRMIKTKLTSISDVYCLYLHNSTPRITYLPPHQLQRKNLLKLCSFNQIGKCDLLFEIRFSNYHIAVNSKKLIKHSEYLRQKYKEWSQLDTIVLDTYSYATYYEYFRFVHTGELRFDWYTKESLAEMYGLACDFQEEHLKTIISSKIYDDSYLKVSTATAVGPSTMLSDQCDQGEQQTCEFNPNLIGKKLRES